MSPVKFFHRNQRGNAFIIILWVIAVLAALIAAFSATALTQYQVTESLRHIGTSSLMAEAGFETWLGLLRTDGRELQPSGLVITEILSYFLAEQITDDERNLISNWHFDNWVGNRPQNWSGSHSFAANWGRESAEPLIGNFSVAVSGGGQRTLSQRGGDLLQPVETGTQYHVEVWVRGTGSVQLGVESPSGHTNWGSETLLEDASWQALTHSATTTMTEGDAGGLEIRTVDDGGDTAGNTLFVGAAWMGVEAAPGGWPQDYLEVEELSFIELYNSGGFGAQDLVGGGYLLENQAGHQFSFERHPADPFYTDLFAGDELPEGEVALALPLDADTTATGLDIAAKIQAEEIRLFALWDIQEDTFSFMGEEGLDRQQLEQIILRRPAPFEDDIVPFDGWAGKAVYPGRSMVKLDPGRVGEENTRNNWGCYRGVCAAADELAANPGEVAAVGADWNAHFGADWFWGGEIVPGVSMGDTVFIPSFGSSPEPADFGYFRVEKIHDESGKQDLNNPRTASCISDAGGWVDNDGCVLGEHTDTGRTMRLFNWAEDIMTRSRPWLTTFDLLDISNIGSARARALGASYSAYRQDFSDMVNLNTASWEALRGIQMAGEPHGSGDTQFITNQLALEIIRLRGAPPEVLAQLPVSSTSDDHFPELGPLAAAGNGELFDDIIELCDQLEQSEHAGDFDCNVFQQYAMLGSEGIVQVEVVGGRIDGQGSPLSRSTVQAVVDRRPLFDGEPLKIMFMRSF